MAATDVMQYQLTLYIDGDLIKGLITTGFKAKPNFETTLMKASNGSRTRDFVNADLEMPFSGETIERDSSESDSHHDFETLRSKALVGATVSFVYGRMTAGEKVVSGTGKITDYGEDAGSEKKRAGFSGVISAFSEDVTDETFATTTAEPTTTN